MKKFPKTKQLHLWKLGGNLCLLRHSNLSRGIFWRHALAHTSLNLKPGSCSHLSCSFNMACLPTSHAGVQSPPEGIKTTDKSHEHSVQRWGLWKMIMTRWSHHKGRCLMIGSCGYHKEREHRDHTHIWVCTYNIHPVSHLVVSVQHHSRMLPTAWSSSEVATQLQTEPWTKSTSFLHKSSALWYCVIISRTQMNTSRLPSPLCSLWEQRAQLFSLKTWCVLLPTATPRSLC